MVITQAKKKKNLKNVTCYKQKTVSRTVTYEKKNVKYTTVITLREEKKKIRQRRAKRVSVMYST